MKIVEFSNKCCVVLLLLFPLGYHCDEEENLAAPEVETALGPIRGYHRKAFSGRLISAFEGIPYAKPPIGERRFSEPEKGEPWDGVWEATNVTKCAQTAMGNPNRIVGNEDCLHINVYVPRAQVDAETDNFDVIVHIHGGSFMHGSGHEYAKPEYLMDRDVIFVTFNYRIGILGFLSTEDGTVPGNNGLKDQVLALKWVKEHIKSFGGNPDSVTLTGLSAGGTCVHYHYLSPLSEGLFHKGVSQSGVALNPWGLQEEPFRKAKRLSMAVGCPEISTNRQMVECLQQRPIDQLLPRISIFYGYEFLPFSPFGPVLERGGKNPFITKNPYYLIAKGLQHDLPWLVSSVSHEGTLPAIHLRRNLQDINANWQKVIPHILDFNYTSARSVDHETAKDVKIKYLGDAAAEFTADKFEKFIEVFSDRLYLVGSETAARLQAKTNRENSVYYYHFSYPGPKDKNPNSIVGHGEDGQYIFYKMFPNKELTPTDLKMKDLLLDILLSFVKTGKPSVENIEWTPTAHKELTYLSIAGVEPEEITLKTTQNFSPREFWNRQGFLENQNVVLLTEHDEL